MRIFTSHNNLNVIVFPLRPDDFMFIIFTNWIHTFISCSECLSFEAAAAGLTPSNRIMWGTFRGGACRAAGGRTWCINSAVERSVLLFTARPHGVGLITKRSGTSSCFQVDVFVFYMSAPLLHPEIFVFFQFHVQCHVLETSSTRPLAHWEASTHCPAVSSHGLTLTCYTHVTRKLQEKIQKMSWDTDSDICSHTQNMWETCEEHVRNMWGTRLKTASGSHWSYKQWNYSVKFSGLQLQMFSHCDRKQT